MKCYRFLVSGKVQGVFYRKSIKDMASLGQIQGYIKNLSNKKVEVVAYLWDDQVEDFETILKNGSPLSEVEDIQREEIVLSEDEELIYDGFEIRN